MDTLIVCLSTQYEQLSMNMTIVSSLTKTTQKIISEESKQEQKTPIQNTKQS